MATNKQRKVLLSLLGSAGLILALDQLVLSPPQGASAGQAAPPAGAPAPVTPAATAASSDAGESAADTSADALRGWNEQLVGIGAATGGDGAPPSPFAPLEGRDPDESDAMSPAEFQAQHKLTAVMTGGDIGVAMINGAAVRIGQEVGGYRLIRVDSRTAEFRAGERTVRLVLPQQVGGGS